MIEKAAIATKKSRKRHLKRIENNESDVILLTNCISKIYIKKPYLKKREKQKKESKNQITEKMKLNE